MSEMISRVSSKISLAIRPAFFDRLILRSAVLLLPTILVGCAVGPDFEPPQTEVPDRFTQTPVGIEVGSDIDVARQWWDNFKDAELSALVAQAVLANKDLEIALARVNQARATRREAFLDLFPTVTSEGTYSKTRIPTTTFAGDAFETGRTHISNEFYGLGLDAFWELDLFGRVRRGVEARDAESAASIAELSDAIRIVISEVARNYFILRGTQRQIVVAKANSKTQEQVVKIAEALFKGGQSTEFDVVRSKAQLSNTLAAIPALEARAQGALYRIAVLCGKQPTEIPQELSKTKDLPVYAGPIRISDPASLLKRRPDIKAAEMRLKAANAGIGVAEGDLFPKVVFNGSIGFQAPDVQGISSGDNDFYRILPSISWPAFNLGRVFANIDRAGALKDGALAQYEQSVLIALEDTESALAQFAAARERRDLLADSVKNSTRATQIARTQYENGLVDLLPVLDAQRVALTTQLELAQSDTELLTSLVSLFKALGGGWNEVVVERAISQQPPRLVVTL
jgi:multidrug efflux system outer membrane protein